MNDSNGKKLVFISHIHEEKDVAIAFKEVLDSAFLGMAKVFVSSDGASISMGHKWLDSVTRTMKDCAVEIIVCSPTSIQRPWIHFEAGGGWVRDIPVIPLCHSGLTPGELPIPLNMLSGAIATDKHSVAGILPVVAEVLGSRVPACDLTGFISAVENFEKHHAFWKECNRNFAILHSHDPEILWTLAKGLAVRLDLNTKEADEIESGADFLRDHKIIDYQDVTRYSTGPNALVRMKIVPMPKAKNILSSPECNYKMPK